MGDLKMPGHNGLEMFRSSQREYPELAERFVLRTGNLADPDEHASELAGVLINLKTLHTGCVARNAAAYPGKMRA
jgi:hypothetical protein